MPSVHRRKELFRGAGGDGMIFAVLFWIIAVVTTLAGLFGRGVKS
jgi:hypothetical protein